MTKLYVHYGCGVCAPEGWKNYDASPTSRLQRVPVLGSIFKRGTPDFPSSILYGDIVKGLPDVAQNSCDGVYSSHVLEHLSLEDCRTAIKNTYGILKPGGVFRTVVPDLRWYVQEYLDTLQDENKRAEAAVNFIATTHLGRESRPRTPMAMVRSLLGNSAHLWMWDEPSMHKELKDAGFASVRVATCGDSQEAAFAQVENPERFEKSIAFEAVK